MSEENFCVLLVSPAAKIRATYPEYLRCHGVVVETADDVIEGLAKAVAHPPAVVVVDDATPGVGDYLTELRDLAATRDTDRVLLVSSVPFEKGLERQAAILLKPVWPDDFFGKVLQLVLRREASHA